MEIKQCVRLSAIEQTPSRGQLRVDGVESPRRRADAATEARRVDGVGRPKFDFHTGPAALLAGWWPAYCRLAPHAILTFPLLEQLRRLAGLENF